MSKITDLVYQESSNLLNGLNAAQLQAVTLDKEGHALVLAGAGSGKTKVLTHRIAWLILKHQVSSTNICSVTFTNKAAKEMNNRLSALVPHGLDNIWSGTFHGINHRFLRIHFEDAKLTRNFQIIDSDDQLSLIRRVMKDQNIDPKKTPPKITVNYINSRKDEGLRSYHLVAENEWEQTHLDIYVQYERLCQQGNLVDFAEILLRAYEVLANNSELLKHYRSRFTHLLIDEFQDTNTIQYEWIKLLNGTTGNCFIVGDDDQSIYGWRGAKIDNIYQFSHDFGQYKSVKEIRLEQNYRSSKHILACANQLISHNSDRLGKNLWTDSETGNKVFVHRALNGLAEADFVINHIESWLEEGHLGSQSVILYRSNAQSRLFEEALLKARIPYHIYGGVRFFQRSEIKDVLAYLRLLVSPDDNTAFLRIINHPPRGIGAKSVEQITRFANEENISYWKAAIKTKLSNSVIQFLHMIEQWQNQVKDKSVKEMLDFIYKNTSLIDYYKNESSEKADVREQNIKELIMAGEDYKQVEDLIAHAALESGEEPQKNLADPSECIQLMTLHSSKGLEFSLVFMVGMEDGLFPSIRGIESNDKLAEERRLAYVGMTRARESLYLTFAGYRQLYGKQFESFPVSRFLLDLPEEHFETQEM